MLNIREPDPSPRQAHYDGGPGEKDPVDDENSDEEPKCVFSVTVAVPKEVHQSSEAKYAWPYQLSKNTHSGYHHDSSSRADTSWWGTALQIAGKQGEGR